MSLVWLMPSGSICNLTNVNGLLLINDLTTTRPVVVHPSDLISLESFTSVDSKLFDSMRKMLWRNPGTLFLLLCTEHQTHVEASKVASSCYFRVDIVNLQVFVSLWTMCRQDVYSALAGDV